MMNWKLVFQLSLFGLAMAVGTVFFIPSSVEPLAWLVIFLLCAFVVARSGQRRLFLSGVAIGIVNSFWVTAAHILFLAPYLSRHPKEAAMMNSMPMPDSPRLMMALTGPVVGVVSGVIIGLLCVLAGKVLRRTGQAGSRGR